MTRFKRYVAGLFSLCLLSALFAISSFLISVFELPVPPALLGIALFFILLLLNRGLPEWMSACVDFLLKHMGLFILPAMISVLAYLSIFQQWALLLFLVIVVSTIISFVLVAWLSEKILSVGNK